MIAKVQSYSLIGLNGVPISVETDINNGNGLPLVNIMSGMVEVIVKEKNLLERLIIRK